MRRIATLFLCLVLLLSSVFGIVSCGSKPQSAPDDTGRTADPGGETATAEGDLYADLRKVDFSVNGAPVEFNILSNWAEDKDASMMDSTDLTTAFSKAIYSRNATVEESLGVEIVWWPDTYANVRNKLTQLQASGDYVYDVVYNESYIQASSVAQGVYTSVNTYSEYLDFGKPWWYSDVQSDLTVADNAFLFGGALNMSLDDMIWCVAFNTTIVANFGATSPFDYVSDNEWTWENFYKLSKDTRGSGKYGITSHYQMADALLFGTGLTMVDKNEDGELVRVGIDDRFTTVYQEMIQKFFEKNGIGESAENAIISKSVSAEITKQYDWSSIEGERNPFLFGNSTFWVTVTNGVKRMLPKSDVEYGVVPIPKYDEHQEKYVGWVSRPAAIGGITKTIEGAPEGTVERVGTVLEWLSAYSHKLVRPAYYDTIMLGRVPRQEETKQMLSVIFGLDDRGMRKMELSATFNLGMVELLEINALDCKPDISGVMYGNAGVIDGKIEEIYEFYRTH